MKKKATSKYVPADTIYTFNLMIDLFAGLTEFYNTGKMTDEEYINCAKNFNQYFTEIKNNAGK